MAVKKKKKTAKKKAKKKAAKKKTKKKAAKKTKKKAAKKKTAKKKAKKKAAKKKTKKAAKKTKKKAKKKTKKKAAKKTKKKAKKKAAKKTKKKAAKKAAKKTKKKAKKKAAKKAAPKKAAPRKSIDEYKARFADWRGEVLGDLIELVKRSAPAASLAIKWGQPVAEADGPFCWMRAHGSHVNIGFWRGSQLEDPGGVLEGSGTKMRHLKIFDRSGVPSDAIAGFVRQAVELNTKFGNPALAR